MAAFPHHGMAAPPGMPPGGQPMGPMHHSNGPPMAHMQGQGLPPGMHPGMPGPNNPHVSQGGPGMMGALPPGLNPNPNPNAMAHLQTAPQMFNQSLQHMTPQQQAMLHQQQQLVARNKAMAENNRQGGPMGMVAPGQGMNPQHFQNIQQQNQMRMNIPNNNMHNPLMATPLMQQQQQQQQQQSGMNGPPQRQAGPPAGPAQQMRGPHGMSSMQPPQPGTQPGPVGHAPAMRPQPSNQGMQEAPGSQQNQGTQPQQQSQPQQQQPQRPQMPSRQPINQSSPPQVGQQAAAGQSQPQQDTPASTAGAQSASTLAGAQEAPNRPTAQAQPQSQPQQAQQQSHQQQQQQQQQSQAQQALHQPQPNQQQTEEMRKQMLSTPIANQVQRNAQLRQNNQLNPMMGHQSAKLKLMTFAEQLGSIHADKKNLPDVGRLQQIVSDYFSENGVFRHGKISATGNPTEKYFEVPNATLARFFMKFYESGVQNIQLIFHGARSEPQQASVPQFLQCDQATIIYTYSNDQIVRHKGTLKLVLGIQDKFESLDFDVSGYDELVSAKKIREAIDNNNSPNNHTKSPSITKKQLSAKKGKIQISENDIPKVPYRVEDGLTTEALRYLDYANTFAQMQPLMVFAQQNNTMSGQSALQRYIELNQSSQYQQIQQMNHLNSLAAAQNGNPQMQFPPGPNGFPQGPGFGMRNPNFPNQMVAGNNSLGIPNANMTGSPHMRPGGSPGQHGLPPHLQGTPMAAQMVAQQSTQGTNSSAPSSNASPNTTNKKRRMSQQGKPDGQDVGGVPQVNGVMDKTKTPKLGQQQKRQRAT